MAGRVMVVLVKEKERRVKDGEHPFPLPALVVGGG